MTVIASAMLQGKIDRIKEFFRGMDVYDGQWVVRVKYRPKWGAYAPDDGSVKVVADENEQDLWWYCANSTDVDIDRIIDLIDETVQTNLEAIRKVELFKLKAGELKKLFSDESIPLRKLQNLRFTFVEDSVPPEKRTPVLKKKEDVKAAVSKKELISQVDDEINGHDVFTSQKTEKEAVQEQVSDVPVQQPAQKRKSQQKVKKEQPSEPVTVSADEMSESEIESLRG